MRPLINLRCELTISCLVIEAMSKSLVGDSHAPHLAFTSWF
ncbi:hypothetical protein SAMN05192544_103017 [Paraburkholderia hospita]|nr:hypothetical protein SAMN05192544_103017 [Paraburkholderia hospita]